MMLAATCLLLTAAGLLVLDQQDRSRRAAMQARLRALGTMEGYEPPPSVPVRPSTFMAFLERLLPVDLIAIGLKRHHVWIAAALVAIGGGAAYHQFGGWGAAGLLLVSMGAAFGFLRRLAARQTACFLDALPGFVDRLRQLVIAGNSPSSAFSKCLAYGTPIERQVFGPAAAVMAHGASLSDALHSRAAKLNLPELYLFAAILRANARYGGDLGTVLGHFEDNLLNRLRARRDFAAMTAEIGMTANILLALPIFAVLGVFSVQEEYFRFFLDTEGGRIAFGYVLVSLGTGFFLVRRMARLDY